MLTDSVCVVLFQHKICCLVDPLDAGDAVSAVLRQLVRAAPHLPYPEYRHLPGPVVVQRLIQHSDADKI